MKFEAISKPKFRITLTGKEAEWLHGILDGTCPPDGVEWGAFHAELLEEVKFALIAHDLNTPSSDDLFEEVES